MHEKTPEVESSAPRLLGYRSSKPCAGAFGLRPLRPDETAPNKASKRRWEIEVQSSPGRKKREPAWRISRDDAH